MNRTKTSPAVADEFQLRLLEKELEHATRTLPKHKIKRLKSIIHRGYCKRFKKPKIPRYGTTNRIFREEELLRFFHEVPNSKFDLLFKFQGCLGLRIGEVCLINTHDIEFSTREIRINSEKTNTTDTMKIPEWLFKELLFYLEANSHAVEKAEGFIFYKDSAAHKQNDTLHLEKNYVCRIFREARARASLNDVYALTDEPPDRKPRRLFRLSTHSFRRYGITKFHNTAKDIAVTRRYARHKSVEQTITYIEDKTAEMLAISDSAFKNDVKQKQLPNQTSLTTKQDAFQVI